MQTETTGRLTTLTPTEKTLYDLLSKRERVHRMDMCQALDMEGDEHDVRAVYAAVHRLRQKVGNLGLQIIVEFWGRKTYYRMIRKIHSSSE